MATSNTDQNSTDVFLRDLLECPVCMETIKSVPVYQCNNGHVICKDCIKKLNNCPICRNDSTLNRNLKLENIVQRLEGIPPKNDAPIAANPNLQKWGMGSVRSYGTINGPNQEPHIETPNPHLESITEAIRLSNICQAAVRQSPIRQSYVRQVAPIGINLQANPWQAMPTQTRPLETRPRQTVYNGEISDWQFLCRLFGTALFLVSICFALFYIAESYNSS